jgi:hypothetical protein
MSGIFVQSLINGIAIPFNGGFDTAMFVSVNSYDSAKKYIVVLFAES